MADSLNLCESFSQEKKECRPRICVKPRTDCEIQLATIMAEVLDMALEDICIDDDIVDELGMNTLTITRFVSLANGRLGRNLRVKDVFLFPTIRRLCNLIR